MFIVNLINFIAFSLHACTTIFSSRGKEVVSDFSKAIDGKIKEIIYMNDHQYYIGSVRSIQRSRIMIQYAHVL